MSCRFDDRHWALILGGSSGFGLATAAKLARHGMNLAIVHRDRKGAMPEIEPRFAELRATGARVLTFNLDALSTEGRKQTLDVLAAEAGRDGRVRLLLHSIAYGNLKPLLPADEAGVVLEDEDFARTVYSMGTSLVTWVQDVFGRRLFASDARVIGLTSEGNQVAWPGYAAVSAAKCALESVARALAVELGPFGVRCNIVQPGVTDTPALRLIPGSERMKAAALAKNPLGRLTTPADVADVICLLSTDEARWVNGALIRVDGGERVAG
ncbi:MAG: SDR family oxidoreductase [Myxococcaceae bacterium]|nr:SDR family oxidoreductase [Myxococcaceae bacterium]